MIKHEELQQKEQKLLEQQDDLSREKHQLEQVQDLYESHIYEGKKFLENLRYCFHQNENSLFFEHNEESLFRDYQEIQLHFEEHVDEIRTQTARVNGEMDNLAFEKMQLSINSKEC